MTIQEMKEIDTYSELVGKTISSSHWLEGFVNETFVLVFTDNTYLSLRSSAAYEDASLVSDIVFDKNEAAELNKMLATDGKMK